MTTSIINIYSILRSFANHQNSGLVHYLDFADYMRRYAQKHIEESPELNAYMTQTQDQLQKELGQLESQKKIYIYNNASNIMIVVIAFYVDKFTLRYDEIANNPAIPFPLLGDIPKNVPHDIVTKSNASDLILPLFEQKDRSDTPVLYGLILPNELPIVLFPSTANPNVLLDASMGKIRQMLRQEEYHDYFLKKLKISNPGKDISVKNFFTQFINKPQESLESLKTSGDSFFFWNQLCYFIRQDYEKVKDYTAEDIAVLQSVFITEFAIAYFKNKSQQNFQRNTALKNLEVLLQKPPYYFSRETIKKFTDTHGIPLLGQYSEKDLNDYLHEKTTSIETHELPDLLVFKTHAPNEQHFYITKSKVLPLCIRLCSDARETVRSNLTKQWYSVYKQFMTLPEMSDQKAFEKSLEHQVKLVSPVLYALLNSNFLSLVHYEAGLSEENKDPARINLFSNGKLIPYSEMLMLNRQEIVTDAKILLPWYYTVPVISWIAALILRPSKKDRKNQEAKSQEQKRKAAFEVPAADDIPANSKPSNTGDRKKDLVNAAKQIESQLVPAGSSLDREISAYINQWNRMLSKDTKANLTEDVNSLIRDYLRKVIRTMQGSSFTLERIQNLSETLAKTPALSKIKDQDELIMYIQLYMVKLVKNL